VVSVSEPREKRGDAREVVMMTLGAPTRAPRAAIIEDSRHGHRFSRTFSSSHRSASPSSTTSFSRHFGRGPAYSVCTGDRVQQIGEPLQERYVRTRCGSGSMSDTAISNAQRHGRHIPCATGSIAMQVLNCAGSNPRSFVAFSFRFILRA